MKNIHRYLVENIIDEKVQKVPKAEDSKAIKGKKNRKERRKDLRKDKRKDIRIKRKEEKLKL